MVFIDILSLTYHPSHSHLNLKKTLVFFQISDSDETQPPSPGPEIQPPPSRYVSAVKFCEPGLEPELVETEAKEPMVRSSETDLTQYATQSSSLQLGSVLPLCEVGISTNIDNQTLNTAEIDTPYLYALDSCSLQLDSTEVPSQHSPSTPALKKIKVLNIDRSSQTFLTGEILCRSANIYTGPVCYVGSYVTQTYLSGKVECQGVYPK